MRVILKETIEALGIIGSTVSVADGYARNYLLPKGKAVQDTPQNRKLIEQQRVAFDLQIAKEKQMAEEMAKRLETVSCTIRGKVSEEDRLYGSVTVRDVMTALAEKGITIDKRMILLKEPIKSLGTYKVPIRVYKGVEPDITVDVIPE
ncbi:MAG: 50S ribosomal protein L9 [Desulfobacteraceae bacterium]|nr:MAG: 50S ribosomal protein L9 [Desulfobacteraceae bacterium]